VISEPQQKNSGANLGYHLSRLPEVGTPSHRVGLCQVVFYQPKANVVAHLIKLLVYFDVIIVEVLA
jgi:hypothetical protein